MRPDFFLATPQSLWEELTAALASSVETAGVLLAGSVDDDRRSGLLVNRVLWVPDDQYLERELLRLRIASPGWVPALKRAADAGSVAIFFHTHPGGEPQPSIYDDEVDAALAGPFRLRTGARYFVSLILGGTPEHPEFTGRVVGEDEVSQPIASARVVGRRISMIPAYGRDTAGAARDIHDRQVRAFGRAGNEVLAALRVGVVGAGGTGSAVTEQLIRLGVRELVVIDDDRITETNVSRVYGSTLADAGRLKVDVVESNAARIGLGTEVKKIAGRIDKRSALEPLRTCDVIFGCTDDHSGRFNLSRLAFYYLVPVIDLGVIIDAGAESIRSITGRVSYVGPGEACLMCSGVVDTELVREEGYEPAERARLAGEGYARGLGEPDPSVIAYTTMVASWGIADLLERLFGFGADDVRPEMRLRIADRKIATRTPTPDPAHICGQPDQWGLGDRPDFLGQRAWPS